MYFVLQTQSLKQAKTTYEFCKQIILYSYLSNFLRMVLFPKVIKNRSPPTQDIHLTHGFKTALV